MKLASTLAFSAFVATAHAFGPAQPLRTNVVNNGGSLQMNVGKNDLMRRQRLNQKLQDAGNNRSKESVETILLTTETSEMIKKCQWKLRKYMIRKVRQQAYAVGAEIDPNFGVPLTTEERKVVEMAAGATAATARAAHWKEFAENIVKNKEARVARKEAKRARHAARAPPAKEAAAPAPAAEEAPAAAAPAPAAGGAVTPATIKQLRDATGAGMMDCKKALIENDGDQESAAEFLRKKGLAKADKKAARVAAEGKIAVSSKDGKTVMVEVNCETDFVGKDATFLGFCDTVAGAAAGMEGDSVEGLMEQEVDGASIEATRQALVAKIGENIQVRRVSSRGGSGTTVGAYVHMNRIGVLVEVEGGNEQLCTDIAMHVAAMNPPYAVPEEVPQDVLENEKRILSEQALESGKPANIVEKMVEGRIRKYLEEICLVSQTYVKDGDKTVAELLKQNDAKMVGFTRLAVGEGIEKKEDDFAAEVAKMAGGN